MPGLPTVTSLPPAPSRSDDQATFVSKADVWVAALQQFVEEVNAVIVAIPEIASAINYNTTSVSSLTIATGSKTFTVPTGGLLQIGQFIVAASTADPSNYMAGQVTSHNSTTGQLIVNVLITGGTGTYADWIIAVTVPDQLTPVSAIATTGSGADLTDNSVTLAKITNAVGSSKLLGSGAAGVGVGAGNPYIEITLGTNLSMTGNTLNVSSGTATLGIGDYGDITVSSAGTVMTIDNDVVTYAKMQNVSATDKLLGRSTAGAGDVEEISCTSVARTLIAQTTQALMRSTGLGLGTIAVMDEATTAQFWSNTADKGMSTDIVWASAVFQSLTQASTIAVDFGAGINFTTTMTGNRTLGAPSNAKEGQSGVIEIKQDATGSRTLAYNAVFKFAGGTVPTLTTTASARDLLYYQVLPGGNIYANLVKNV
jgi:hypothetical protein